MLQALERWEKTDKVLHAPGKPRNPFSAVDLAVIAHVYHHPRYALSPAMNQYHAEPWCTALGWDAFWHALSDFALTLASRAQ
jgi:hypothetical protein